jgi:hypothetical protein
MFENRMLRRIFGPEEVKEGCTKLHIEDFHNLYSSRNKIKMMKFRRIRWAVHVTCI